LTIRDNATEFFDTWGTPIKVYAAKYTKSDPQFFQRQSVHLFIFIFQCEIPCKNYEFIEFIASDATPAADAPGMPDGNFGPRKNGTATRPLIPLLISSKRLQLQLRV